MIEIMNKSIVIIGLLVSCLFLTSPIITHTLNVSTVVFALPEQTNQTSNVTAEPDLIIDRQFYKPTKVIFNFPYTHNSQLENINTIGMSDYTFDGGPTTFTFIAKDVDVYTFTLHLTYENASARKLLIGVSQGNLPMEGYTLKLVGEECLVTVRLNLTEQPSYPSVDAVAKETVHQMEQLIATQIEQNRQTLIDLQTTQATTAIVSMISVICSIVTLVLVLWFTSKVKRGVA